MALSNFQFLWNGLTFGAGTDIQLVKEEGLRSLPQVRSGDIAKPRMDGYYAGFQYLNERIAVLTLAVTVTKTDPFETVVANIANAFQPYSDPTVLGTLQFMYPGWANPRQVYGRVTRAGFTTDLNYSFHRIDSLPVEFTCSNPVIYDSVLTSTSVALATAGTFPLTTLSTLSSVGASSITVTSSTGFVAGQTVSIDSTISGTTTLTAASAAGATSITVASNTGFLAGQTVYIDSGTYQEARVILSTSGSTIVNLVASLPLLNPHAIGVTVYAVNTEQRTIASITGNVLTLNTPTLALAHAAGVAVSGSTFPVNLVLTSTSGTVSAGTTALTVTSSAGFYAGQTVFLDLNATEILTVASVPDSTHVTLVSGPVNTHTGAQFLWNGMGFAPTTGGAISTNNIGNYKTLPVFTIQGPVTNPLLTLTSTGEFFGLTTTLSSSDSMVIDMQNGTVILNGTATRYNLIVPGSTWFGLPPGGGNVKVSSSDSTYPTGNSFRADYRSAWSWV